MEQRLERIENALIVIAECIKQGELYQQSHAESMSIDDYLNSEEFKELSGAKSLSGLVK